MNRVLLGLTIIAVMAACADNEDDSTHDSRTKAASIEKTAADGQWRLIFFSQNGHDETGQFHGYIFDFDEGNLITVTNGSENFPGNWAISTTESNELNREHEFGNIDFKIFFNTPADFESLTEDWEIVSLTDSKMELRHLDSRKGDTDVLTFERI